MDPNITYYPYIASVVDSLPNESFTLLTMIDQLHDAIVDCYDGDVFADYKRGWMQAVVEYFKTKQVELASSKYGFKKKIDIDILIR